MAVAHVAIVRLVSVDGVGNIVHKSASTTSICNVIPNAGTEARVFAAEAGSAPNAPLDPKSVTAPTVTEYIQSEAVAGFKVRHLGQTFIVTDDL